MKFEHLLHEIILENIELGEMGMNSRKGDDPSKKFNFISNALIDYMDKNGITTIPTYTALSYDNKNMVDITKYEPNAQKPLLTWKYILNSFLGPKEFDLIVKPLIAKLRPEFNNYSTGSKLGAKNHVIDGMRMASIGEIITYNTFKMNGIILEHEPQDQVFTYTYIGLDGLPKTVKKIPDFYWREKNMMIEVAGLKNGHDFAKNYTTKINAAKDEMLKQDREYVILDYYIDRNNTQKFFKTVCDRFNFRYNMADYPKAITGYQGVDRNYCEKEVKRILSISTKESTGGERRRAAVMINNCLSKTIETPEGTEEVPYTSKYDVRDDMGILRRSNPEIRNRVQEAWCKSPFFGPKKVTIVYNEIYDDKINHKTVEIIINRNRNLFDKNNKETICSKFNEVKSGEEELNEGINTFENTNTNTYINMKLTDILTESKSFDEFAEKRMGGASKIANNAKEKGGPSMLTYHHFKVKLPYYKEASEGKFDMEESKKEFIKTLKSISLDMNQTEFQIEVGRLEVLGELIIKHK